MVCLPSILDQFFQHWSKPRLIPLREYDIRLCNFTQCFLQRILHRHCPLSTPHAWTTKVLYTLVIHDFMKVGRFQGVKKALQPCWSDSVQSKAVVSNVFVVLISVDGHIKTQLQSEFLLWEAQQQPSQDSFLQGMPISRFGSERSCPEQGLSLGLYS